MFSALLSWLFGKSQSNASDSSNNYGITNNQLFGSNDIQQLIRRVSNPRSDNDTIFAK